MRELLNDKAESTKNNTMEIRVNHFSGLAACRYPLIVVIYYSFDSQFCFIEANMTVFIKRGRTHSKSRLSKSKMYQGYQERKYYKSV